jgi:hypothetical protein
MSLLGDTITEAWPADPRVTLAKIIHLREGEIVAKDASPNVAGYKFAEHPVHDLESLGAAVQSMGSRGSIAVRGKPNAPTGRRAIYDDPEKGPAGLAIVPRRWVAFDWDGLPFEPQSEPQPIEIASDEAEFCNWSEPDPLLDPDVGAKIALRRLPPAFRNVGCFWQVSAGAGYNPGFRLRTWHWLNHPITGAEAKAWLRPAITRKLVDPVTLVEAQPHYLGVVVVGGADPCPNRFGLLPGRRAEVVVPDIEGIQRRQRARDRDNRPRPPSDADEGKEYADRRIADCIATIKAATYRHTTYMSEAARAKAICDRYGIDWAPVSRDLIAAYQSTLNDAEAAKRERTSTRGVVAWLEGRPA